VQLPITIVSTSSPKVGRDGSSVVASFEVVDLFLFFFGGGLPPAVEPPAIVVCAVFEVETEVEVEVELEPF
jgi:hypothetical protein